MIGKFIIVITGLIIGLSAVTNGLAIGFEVDTPLDPFLGGLSKIKRQIIRRVKDLGNDDSFINGSPIDQLNRLFAGHPTPINLPQFTFPTQTSQQPFTTQLPMTTTTTTIDQRKIGFNQIPSSIAQAMDSQLITFLNQGLTKRGLSYPSLPGLRQIPGIVQQLSQTLPMRSYSQCVVNQPKQSLL